MNKIKIKNIADNIKAWFDMVGGKDMQNIFISPLGLYSKPKNGIGLSLDNNKYSIALQDHNNIPVSLKDNDIVLTDGKNFIFMEFKAGVLNISSDSEITIRSSSIVIEGDLQIKGNVNIKGDVGTVGTLKNNYIDVGSTHKHAHSKPFTSPPLP